MVSIQTQAPGSVHTRRRNGSQIALDKLPHGCPWEGLGTALLPARLRHGAGFEDLVEEHGPLGERGASLRQRHDGRVGADQLRTNVAEHDVINGRLIHFHLGQSLRDGSPDIVDGDVVGQHGGAGLRPLVGGGQLPVGASAS